MANQLNTYNYQTPNLTHLSTSSPDCVDLRGDMGRTRASSFGARPTVLNSDQSSVSGKRRKSLCNIGPSKSEPTNVLNAAGKILVLELSLSELCCDITGHMLNNKVKRVNSLNYVRDGKLNVVICSRPLKLFT